MKNNKLNLLLNQAKLVIFDMNGLIIDDEPIQLASFNSALKKYNIKVSRKKWIEDCVGKRTVEIFPAILKENNLSTNKVKIIKFADLMNRFYRKNILVKIKKIRRTKIKNIFNKLVEEGRLMAVASSASNFEINVVLGKKGLNLKKYFKYIINGDQVKRGKPNPEIYKKVARLAGVKPKDCLVFEDSNIGVRAAYSAGMKVVAVPNAFTKHQDFSRANLVI